MEQDKKCRKKPIHPWAPYLWQIRKNIQWRKQSLFKKWSAENWTATCKRMKLEHSLTPSVQFSSVQFNSVQSLSRVRLFATPWITARQASLSITNSQSSLKFMFIKSVMTSSHLILCRPLLRLPSIPPSIRVFSKELTLRMRWPTLPMSFSLSISPSNERPGLISFRINWLDLLAVQGTLKSLLQHHSSKHQFFGAQVSSQSNPHIHTWPLEKPLPWLDRPLLAK